MIDHLPYHVVGLHGFDALGIKECKKLVRRWVYGTTIVYSERQRKSEVILSLEVLWESFGGVAIRALGGQTHVHRKRCDTVLNTASVIVWQGRVVGVAVAAAAT